MIYFCTDVLEDTPKRDDIVYLVKKRWEWMKRPIHGFAAPLHPAYKKPSLFSDQVLNEERMKYLPKVLKEELHGDFLQEVINYGDQRGILIENMRREGFELSVSPPAVMYKIVDNVKLEPVEEVIIEVDDEHSGTIIESMSHRRGELADQAPCAENAGRTRLTFTCPSRGLVGYRSVFNTETHGTGFMHRAFLNYENYRGPLGNVRKGVLVSMAAGTITAHALVNLEARGILFVQPGQETYNGMIIGEYSRDSDLEVNPVKTKELTNVRAACKDENVRLTPPRQISLEEAIGYVASDELIEVTPKVVRLRKKYLDANKRRAVRRTGKE
ncbi:hypothetical protein L7F22_031528 [Adiantum nelumboides]|nr:hypothetical protein [Adiantum nelumboides]